MYHDLPKRLNPHEEIKQWVDQTLMPGIDKINDIRTKAAHKADLHDMGMITSGLLLQIGRYRAMARQELAKAKASESRRIEQEANIAKDIDAKRVTKAEAKMMLAENLADWQYYVDLLGDIQDGLGKQLSFLQSSIRAMREEEFMPQDGSSFS
jgi:hypothetical protein